MDLSDFDYDLPESFIAQTPTEPRDHSRLLVLHRDSGDIEHRQFFQVIDYLRAGDVLVINQTRVIPARLHASKVPGGGLVEVLLLERIDDRRWLCWIGGKRVQAGRKLLISGSNGTAIQAEIIEAREGAERVIAFDQPIEPHLDTVGEMPLPPYIHTPLTDPNRYQTVYAQTSGSVAAPTAGLHFTPDLLSAIEAHGVTIVRCTLHVGAGTFEPVRADQIADHKLHAEYAELTPQAADQINAAKARGSRVIAVGTTSVRTIETAARRATESQAETPVISIAERTTLFITPGDVFHVVDAMITNFHLPHSTLLMLVSAFAGREKILNAYEIAKQEGYKFYSLGDAMLIV